MYNQDAISEPLVSYGNSKHAMQADTAKMPYTVTALLMDVCKST